MRAAAAAVITLLATAACTSGTTARTPSPTKAPPVVASTPPVVSPTPPPRPATLPTSNGPPAVSTPVAPFDSAAALGTVRHLAGLGPREATSTTYLRALSWLEQRFRSAGYQTRRQALRVPAGVSWGVPVRAGTTWNLIATKPGFNSAAPHRIVGAHLDTVPQAPGAEDNASGISVLLGTAQVHQRPSAVFVAFGAEEPRGDGDNRHHYGSRAYVASLPPAQRRALRGMVSLDRVGVGSVVPICSAAAEDPALRNELRAAATRVRVESRVCVNRSSDHWSFVRSGLPGVRLGSTPYAEYHSAQDLPRVVSPAQLDRTGRVLTAWLDS
ncbi:peptidase M28-like protein [Kribbella antiqua]|uniref:Peptidase M28-like protein n=1 Tax=Kribbella antiqua TaxID=2512217 RepID=A0A4R2I5N9_9ACTN|nr:M28 family peptidase [Kribbella antiqua]TCO37815.1 peptidase M28-like protein [Kribbella antiqua]